MKTSEGAVEVTVDVTGMTCRHCVRAVTAQLRDVPGVATVVADAVASTVVVTGRVSAADVLAAIQTAGFAARLRTVTGGAAPA